MEYTHGMRRAIFAVVLLLITAPVSAGPPSPSQLAARPIIPEVRDLIARADGPYAHIHAI